ncbi:MAG: helix-turn-helix transcriptional regulator, partial [Chloroflexi bacterium]|nr:helix-turn-helix transcriptional regulator [Chloroflexota bacterium]
MGLEQAPTFAQLLKGYRLAAGLTQDELAARANLSVRAISDLERGVKTRPYLNTVQVLSDALGLAGDERPKFVAVARRPSGPVRNRSMGDAAP